jgi:hypothetical protein
MESKMSSFRRWVTGVSKGLFYRNEETPRVLRWVYDMIDEDLDDLATKRDRIGPL